MFSDLKSDIFLVLMSNFMTKRQWHYIWEIIVIEAPNLWKAQWVSGCPENSLTQCMCHVDACMLDQWSRNVKLHQVKIQTRYSLKKLLEAPTTCAKHCFRTRECQCKHNSISALMILSGKQSQAKKKKSRRISKYIQKYLRDIELFLADHCKKAFIAIKWVTKSFWIPSIYKKLYLYHTVVC